MKIVSYNIARCTQSKIDHVLGMGADLNILPECACREQVTLPEGYDMLWTGDDDIPNKGLGVIWKNHLSVNIVQDYRKIRHHLPLLVNGAGFPKFVLACWPTISKEEHKTYPQLLLEALMEYSFYLDRFPAIALGDFNCFIGQKGVSRTTRTFEDCIFEFDGHGMNSMYHAQVKENFGRESEATFFWRFNEKSPFFLDYAFSSIEPKHFSIGKWEPEISDHRPLIIEIEDEEWDENP